MIVSSKIIEDAPQKDGRRWITERHTRDDGTYQDVTYMAESTDAVGDMLLIRAAQIEAEDSRIANLPPEEKTYTQSEVLAKVEKIFGKDGKALFAPELAQAADAAQAAEIE